MSDNTLHNVEHAPLQCTDVCLQHGQCTVSCKYILTHVKAPEIVKPLLYGVTDPRNAEGSQQFEDHNAVIQLNGISQAVSPRAMYKQSRGKRQGPRAFCK